MSTGLTGEGLLASGVALAKTGSLTVLFFVAGSTYLTAWLIFYLRVPRLAPVR